MPSQNTLLGTIVQFLIANPIVALVLLSILFNVVRAALVPGKPNPQEQELQRRRRVLEQQLQQDGKNVVQQPDESIEAYLRRTRPEKLEDHDQDGYDDHPDGLFKDPPPPASSRTAPADQSLKDFQADILAALGMKPETPAAKNAQDALRGQLAQKMGRSAKPKSPEVSAQTVRSRAKSISTAQSASSGITSSLNPEITAQKVTLMTDSNANVANSSIQVKLEREKSTTTSNSTRFGTTNDVVRGIIWSEILAKPKSSRR